MQGSHEQGRRQRVVDGYRRLSQLSVPPQYPLAQFPNLPLWVAIGGWVGERVLPSGAAGAASAAATAGILGWAWLELLQGVNLFRRALGAVVLAGTVVRLAGQLG